MTLKELQEKCRESDMTLKELQDQLAGRPMTTTFSGTPTEKWPRGMWQAQSGACCGMGESLEQAVLRLLEGLEQTAAWERKMRAKLQERNK